MASHTLRPGAVRWRAGDDGRRHAIAIDTRPLRAACGGRLLEERYDRPDIPRCADCLAVVGITVPAPGLPWTETELRAAHGDR